MAEITSFLYKNKPVKYEILGKGKPLVVLHGWGSNRKVMMPLCRQLADIRTCYVFDLPGFGDSEEPVEAWSVDDYADLVEAFITENFSEQVDLLVHSFGGRIALKLCARSGSNQKIDKVLITGGAGMKPKRSLKFYLKKYFVKLLKAPFMLLPPKLREKGLAWLRTTSVWKGLGSSDYSKLTGVMRQTFVKTVTEYLEPTLGKITNEVLLLWGANDVSTPVYQAKRIENGIKNAALVVIEEAGHYAFLDRPTQFALIAKAFYGV